MQTSKYNGIKVTGSAYGSAPYHIGIRDEQLTDNWTLDCSRWHQSVENPEVTLYKARGRRLIVAVHNGIIIDGECWDIYGNEYRYAQKSVEARWELPNALSNHLASES